MASRGERGARPAPGRAAALGLQAAGGEEIEHRDFPRAPLAVRVELWREVDGRRTFGASLRSANLSVSGAFLESSFFLPLGTGLRARLSPGPEGAPVEAHVRIVREERPGPDGRGRSGFGVRFEEFLGQSEVTLARLFLEAPLRAFAGDYLASRRAATRPDELERVVDALAAWELRRALTGADPWREG